MMKLVALFAGAALVGLASAGATSAHAAPGSRADVTNVSVDVSAAKRSRKKVRRHVHVHRAYPRAAQVYVAPGPRYVYPGYGGDAGYPFDPRRIGPGGAYQGNIPGCAVDLGYGRYESCNVFR